MTKWKGLVSPTSINLSRTGVSGVGGLAALAVLVAVAVSGVVAVLRSPSWMTANEIVGNALGLAVAGLASGVTLWLGWIGVALPLWENYGPAAHEAKGWRARWDAGTARREAREFEHLTEQTAKVDAAIGDLADEGLDGARDGKLVDATDRFRRLGTFPADGVQVDQAAGGA